MKAATTLILSIITLCQVYSQIDSSLIDTLPFGASRENILIELDTAQNTIKSGEITLSKSDCEINLRSANESYNLGDFSKVISSLSPCVEQEYLDDNNMLAALVLLASTYCADDNYTLAQKYVNEILTLEPDFRVRNEDLIQFKIIFEEEKKRRAGAQVSSVSKFSENLYQAPATVMLITEEQIKNRGYMDLEELLHDIPGFDFARSNGVLYSHIYQRGYRVPTNNRILLLIDGIEENDLWGNILYLSRQYPLSNIKSVEVVYGPVSTVYGPNGFLGVISINTKSPAEFLPKSDNISVAGEIGYGQWNTRYLDGTVAVTYPKQDIDLSVTYRHFRSNEAHFGELDHWNDYKPWRLDDDYQPNYGYNTVRDLYRDKLSITNDSLAQVFYNQNQNHPYANFFRDTTIDGQLNIVPTELGLQSALARDNELVAAQSYQDYTKTDMISLRFRFKNLYVGFHRWVKQEGLGLWFSDVNSANDGFWSPRVTAAFVKYEQQLQKKFLFSSFARYKLHGFHNNNYLSSLRGYRNSLGLTDLLDEVEPEYISTYYATHSNQVRLENRLYYIPSVYRTAMIGMENRLSSIQDNYYTATYPNPESNEDNDVSHYFTNDLGFYGQFSQKMGQLSPKLNDLSATVGVRWDHNEVHGERRLKPHKTFRSVLIYHPKNYVLKFIYSSAFKTPTNQDLYSTVAGVRDVANPNLLTEKVNNLELSARRFLDHDHKSSVQLTGFYSVYREATETVTLPNGLKQLQSIGERLITGVEGTADYHYKWLEHKFYFWGNYSFILPYYTTETSVQDELIKLGDMSPHKFNIGVNYNYEKTFNANIRMNFLGRRQTGEGTTVSNMYADSANVFGATAILHGALTYKLLKYGIDIQFVANNILNTKYFAPGIRSADGTTFSPRLPQNPRALHLKVRFNLAYNTRHLQDDQLIEH